MRRWIVLGSLLVAAAGIASAQSPAAEWPQLFGPARNATALAPIAAGSSLSVAWRKPMPAGGAGLVVKGERVYTLGTDNEEDVLFAFDTATGELVWRFPLSPTHSDAVTNGPSSTPALTGGLVVTVSSLCQLQAIDTQTRQVAWTHSLGGTYGSRFAKRGGCGMSPLVAGSRVVVPTAATQGAQLAAFDVATGKEAWTVTDIPNPAGLEPGWMDAAGGHVLYRHSKPAGVSGITAVNAANGAIVWQIDGKDGESSVTPVPVGNDRVLIENWPHVSLYDLRSRTALWTSREISAQRAPAVAHNGHIYTFGGQSGEFLTCVDAATGQVKWTSRIYRGHLGLAGETLVVLSESSGLLRLVAADPAGYRELAKVQVLTAGARTGTPPSIAGGRIFVRNLEEIVGIRVHER
ncbi:MAG TPA: PQQ-binding-like beta-propeller repeat protein [Vicinamibacterales bacterium]|nr:PQQ-binding-like beta-propeller repeat protein [Vicinamibacterales bacterium]